MKSLLFIGGTGFLGQSFFDYIKDGKLKNLKLRKIIVVSRKKKKIKCKISTKFIKSNISSLKKLPITDYIIYAANSSNYAENIKGIKNFNKLLNESHKKTKILFTSSGAVYGKTSVKKRLRETDKISIKKINNLDGYKKNYAKSKVLIENEFIKFGKKGFNVSIARLFTFIGRKILINNNFAVTNLLNQAWDPKLDKITLSSKNDVYRGYMNSNDLIRWIIKILINSNSNCNIYNVGSDESVTINKLAKLISYKFKKHIDFKNPNISAENLDYYVPSVKKAKKILKLKIKYNLKQSLNELY